MNELQQAENEILIEFSKILDEASIPYFLNGGTLLGAVRHKGFIPWDDDADLFTTREYFDKAEDAIMKSPLLTKGYRYQSMSTVKYYNSEIVKLRNNSMNIREIVSKTQHGYDGPWVDLFVFDKLADSEQLRDQQISKVLKLNKIILLFTHTRVKQNDKGVRKFFKGTLQFLNEHLYKGYFFIPMLVKRRRYWMTKYKNDTTEYSVDLCYAFHKNKKEVMATAVRNESLMGHEMVVFEGREYPAPLHKEEVLESLYGNYMEIPEVKDRKQHNIEHF